MLIENQIAPDFDLPVFEGDRSRFYSTSKTAVLIFYKFSCGTCRFTFPFLEKIYGAYGDAFYFVAIAQDSPEKIAEFRRDLGISIPTLIDMEPYPASSNYCLTAVPSIFLIHPDHHIQYAGHGFVKQEILNLADILAQKSGRPQIDLFGDAEVPEIKPG